MSSFLSFVYRRQSSAPACFESTRGPGVDETTGGGPRQHYLPPGVTSSGSSDTDAWVAAPHSLGSSSSSQEDDDGHIKSPFAARNGRFGASPATPDGLLPRRSADSLRRELNLPSRRGGSLKTAAPRREKKLAGVAKILAGMESNDHPTIDEYKYNVESSHDEEDDNMILAPPDDCLESKPTFDSSVLSPQVSTSSFYSRQSSRARPVAMSPVLQVGQARTAVGALVALREAHRYCPNNNTSMTLAASKLLPKAGVPDDKSNSSNKEQNEPPPLLDQSFAMSVLPPRSSRMVEHDEDDIDSQSEAGSETENVPYLPPVASHTVATPTFRRRHSIAADGDFDNDSCMYASPSSIQFQQMGYCNQQPQQQGGALAVSNCHTRDSSKSSLISHGKLEEQLSDDDAGLEDDVEGEGKEQITKYDYDLHEEEVDAALMSRKFRNQQLGKQTMMDAFKEEEERNALYYEQHGFDDNADLAGTIDKNEQHEHDYVEEEGAYHCDDAIIASTMDSYDKGVDAYAQAGAIDLDEALQRRKTRNQRQEKEMCVLEVVARLRDNVKLVNDIEAAASSSVAAMGSWFVRTPVDTENLLTGLSSKQRNCLLMSIDSILNEMEIAQPEEFILSPSRVPVMATTHDTLSQALRFCRTLILAAVPQSEKEQMVMNLPCNDKQLGQQQLFAWASLPELRCALGIASPQSPDTVRGGGTSLFSLPDESGADTPHTSNVSMATSITSVNTYSPRRTSGQFRPQLIMQQDGLQLRQTVEVVSSLLQKLTLSCLQLGELSSKTVAPQEGSPAAKTYVHACDDIKQLYLQLLAVSKQDYKALMEVFHLELVSPIQGLVLAPQVSTDEDDQMIARTRAHQKQVLALASALGPPFPEQRQHRDVIRNPFEDQSTQDSRQSAIGERALLFSPSTEDMRSKTGDYVPYEFDDLRRQVGSYDREDNDDGEERDGPCQDEYGGREDAEEWRRMYHNVSLAASSIRSTGLRPKGRGWGRPL